MNKKDICKCFGILFVVLCCVILCIKLSSYQKQEKAISHDTGMIKRSPTGQFTRGGAVLKKKEYKNVKSIENGIIYIGEPTEGLLD